MRIQVLLLVKCGTEFAAASTKRTRERARKNRDVYAFVDSRWKNIEPVNLLKPVESWEEISPSPRVNFELVEVWMDSPLDTPLLSTKPLYVDMWNLFLVRRLFSECSGLDYVANFTITKDEMSALTDDNVCAIHKFMESGATVTYRHPNDGTLAHFAAMRNSPALITALGKCGADLNAARNDGGLPLHVAVKEGHMDALLALLDSGADVNGEGKDGYTALHDAVGGGDIEAVRILIERGADVNKKAVDDWTPLHVAAEGRQTAIVDLLLKSGASTDAKGVGTEERDGVTPLHVSMKLWDMKSAELLINNGADYETVDSKGNNVFFFAITTHHAMCFFWEVFFERGVDVKNPGNQKAALLAMQSEKKDPYLLRELILSGFSVPEENMTEILCLAVGYDFYEVVEKLLDLGAQVCKIYGFRRFTRSVEEEMQAYRKIMQLLLDHGADLVVSTELLETFNHAKSVEVLKLLLDRVFSIRAVTKSEKPGRKVVVYRQLFFGCKFKGLRKILAQHVMKLEAAAKAAGEDFDSASVGRLSWIDDYRSDKYLEKCERELNVLKNRTISGTDVKLFQFLDMSIDRFARIVRDKRSRSELDSFNSSQEFPCYGGVIESRLRRATCRRQYLVKGLKAFNRLTIRLPALPLEVKERIVESLANHECARLDACFKS